MRAKIGQALHFTRELAAGGRTGETAFCVEAVGPPSLKLRRPRVGFACGKVSKRTKWHGNVPIVQLDRTAVS